MIKAKKALAIIPARSGSKGLKDKNIKELNGKPMIAYTIEAAIKSHIFDDVVVSTDSKEYAEIARAWGANVPFIREKELASDIISSWDVVRDALLRYAECGKSYDTVALLQPTSPLRTAKDIIEAYNNMKEKDANIVIAVCEVDHSPLWVNVLPKNLSFDNFIKKDILNIPRQSLPTYYRVNGAIYIVKTEYLLKTKDIYADKSFAFLMTKENSIDIDDELDFRIAEILIKDSIKSKRELL